MFEKKIVKKMSINWKNEYTIFLFLDLIKLIYLF